MIGLEVEITKQEDAVGMSFNPETDDYVVELSPEAFEQFVMALDHANNSEAGYYGRHCFDVDDDE